MSLRTLACLMTLVLGLLMAPRAIEAQQLAKIPRIGYLVDSARRAQSERLRQGLRDLGYVEGQNIAFEWRFADTPAQYPALAAELVGLPVDLIVAHTGLIARAAQQATSTIPIVMEGSTDPVGMGMVASLAHPGGNLTGVTGLTPDLSPKALALLKEAMPGIARVAIFTCPGTGKPRRDTMKQREREHLQVTAQQLGLDLHFLELQRPDAAEDLFDAAVRERADALLTLDCYHINNVPKAQMAGLAVKHRMPGMYHYRSFVTAGGLMAYAPNYEDLLRGVAVYVDKILKGAQPATLPVLQPIRFHFVINLTTATALGLTIPPSLLFQATEVIR